MTCRIAILLSIGFGEQDTTASEHYRTGGEFNLILRSPLSASASLDHPICPVKHRLRNRNADLFRSSEIDHQFKLRRLLHGKITRLSAFQNLVNEVGSAPERIRLAHPVGHETTTSAYSPEVQLDGSLRLDEKSAICLLSAKNTGAGAINKASTLSLLIAENAMSRSPGCRTSRI